MAAAVLVTPGRLVAAAGAGFALSTLGGYLLSVRTGLFGFKEVRTTAGIRRADRLPALRPGGLRFPLAMTRRRGERRA
jgi:hypothetical protein